MQNNQFLLEELRRLQQRRQQELIQQQIQQLTPASAPPASALSGLLAAASATNNYPLSSLQQISGLIGQRQVVQPDIDNELIKQILGHRQAPQDILSRVTGNDNGLIQQLIGLEQRQAPQAAQPDMLSRVNHVGTPQTNNNEELLRKVAAAGLLGATAPPAPPAPPAAAPAAAAVPTSLSLLSSLVATGAIPTKQGQRKKREKSPVPHSPKRQRIEDPPATNLHTLILGSKATAVNVLASAAEMKPIPKELARGNSFPLPGEKDSSNKGVLGMPKLGSFHKAWDSVKSKKMQKEIFLRKLHAGKLFPKNPTTRTSAPRTSAAPGTGLTMVV